MKLTALCFALALSSVSNFAYAQNAAPAPKRQVKAPVVPTSMVPNTIPVSPVTGDDHFTDLPNLNLDSADGTPLTLDECVRLGIQAATNVLKAENNSEFTGAALLQGYGQFLPNLTATASNYYNSGTNYYITGIPALVNGATQSVAFAVTADLNIFNGLSDISNLKSTILKKDAADLSVVRAKQAIALDIAQSYLNVLLDDRLVEIAQKNLQESRAHENLLAEQTRVGARNLADLFRQQAQTSADESLLLNSENKKRTDQIQLLQKLRADISKKYHFVDFQINVGGEDPRYQDESRLLQEGLEHRVDLKASDKNAEAANFDTKTKWANYLPKLDLVGTLSGGGGYLFSQNVNGVNAVPPSQTSAFSQVGNQTASAVGLVLTWNVFDRLATHLNVETAEVAASNALIDAQDLKNQVMADVRLAYSNYKTSSQQLIASKKGLAAAVKAYEVIEGRYEVGAANFLDLVTAQAALLQAESSRVVAITNFKLQGKVVEFAIGELKVQ